MKPLRFNDISTLQGLALDDFFEAVPTSLWLEDYSLLYQLFKRWREQGVEDLDAWLQDDPARVQECANTIRIRKVNRHTLDLFVADSAQMLMGRLDKVIRDDTLEGFVGELVQLWNGTGVFQGRSVNYTLDGRRLDIVLKGVVLPDRELPWDQVLIAVEDVTDLTQSNRRALASEQMAREFFEQAPVSLWVEDFSRIKELLDELRAKGIVDFRTFIDVHPEFIERCMSEIRVLDVNDYTVKMFKAQDRDELLRRVDDIFSEDMVASFGEQLIDLWEGRLFQQKEVRNRTVTGEVLYIHLQLSVFKGHEDDWGMMLLALTDITARKKAEAYLEYLGTHDVLTQLKNRSFYVDELARLSRRHFDYLSFIALDLNELKGINDAHGHAAGDALLRRMGEVLNKVVDRPASVSRVGGDEFMILLPGAGERQAHAVRADISRLIELNNQFYGGIPLSVSVGIATANGPQDLERALRTADLEMYRDKREHHGYRRSDDAAPI